MTHQTETLYCENHPSTETTLRCNRCEKPICTKCAVLTPVGYRCKECVRGQQKIYDTAEWYDYLTAFITASLLAYIGSRFVPFISFFTIFLAPIVGIAIDKAVRFVTRRRRSKRLFQLTTVAVVLGCLPILLLSLTALPLIGRAGFGVLFGIIWPGLYTFTITSTVYYRLVGINIRA